MSRPEILAPAGNREMLGAAVFSGADAVYLGLTGFNARRTAGYFTPDELPCPRRQGACDAEYAGL